MQLAKGPGIFYSRWRILFLIPFSLVAIAVLWALYETPYDGPWLGTNSESRAVSFTVQGNGTQWMNFSYAIQFVCSEYGGTIQTTIYINPTTPSAITDGTFSYSGTGIAIAGAFDTAMSASGTCTLTDYPVIHTLPYFPYLPHTDYITLSGTWTATFNGTLPTVTVTSPNGGESWEVGSSHDITWTWTGDMPNVQLEYSANGGADWATIVESASNSGSYAWTVPGPASATCLVRVTDAAYPGVFDTSDAAFSMIQAVPGTERAALVALYNSTSGDSWTDNSGWKTPPLHTDGFAMPGTEGSWYRVTVDAGTMKVTHVILEHNNLSGSLPAGLSNLVNLQQLRLSVNNLGGSIPVELGSLNDLQSLGLRYCGLSGSIPSELGNLTNLQHLDLGVNQLSGSIPFELGNLADLWHLDLSDNQLSGSIPASFGNLTSLLMLNLYSNQLSSSIPSELGSLAELQDLYLVSNQLSGPIPPELGNLTKLLRLYLGSNQLSGSIPPELGNLASLQALWLAYNQLSGPVPSQLGSLANLENFWLSYNQLSGSIPPELGNLTNVRALHIASNQLSGLIPPELGNLVGLQELYLGSNQLTGPIPSSLMNLTALSSYYTSLSYNALYTSDEALIAFLNSKDPDWAATQTIAPTDVTATALDGASILVSWLPIPYTANAGYYKIYSSETGGGPYTLAGQTADKSVSSLQVNGLTPCQAYFFVVQTHTDAHISNQNIVESAYSTEASATAWTQVNVRIAGMVTVGGSPLAGVAMSGLDGNPTTNESGVYDVTVAAGWSGTVTPTLVGYTFAPPNRSYASLEIDQLNQDYEGALTPTTITLMAPNGGEAYATGSTCDITWTWTGDMPNVKLEYSTNDGTDWVTILETTPNSGSYAWTVPGPASPTCLVRVTDAAYPGVSDTSDAVFSMVTSVPTTERAALIALYSSTNGDSWANNSGWKMPPLYTDGFAMPGTEGTWYGVTVDAGSLRVTEIQLAMNGLSGSIPLELGNLTEMQSLSLCINQLSGSIPAELGTMTSLQYLYLHSNQLSGSIPAELGDLSNLLYLNLELNQLSGSIPADLGNLINLRLLDLSSNQLSSFIPLELGNLVSLQTLYLYSNQLSGTIPVELGNLLNLVWLRLDNNELSGSIPAELGNLANLQRLWLYINQLSGPIPSELGDLAELQYMNISSNQLSGPIPSELGNLTNLRNLTLSQNQLGGSIPSELGNLIDMQVFYLNYNQLAGSIPAELGNLANLQNLWLQSNQLSGPIPVELGNLTNLSWLRLNSNQLSGPVPVELTGLTSLTLLSIAYNALYATDPDLVAFLNSKESNWAATQTTTPADVAASAIGGSTITVTWTPILYQGDSGGYIVSTSPTPGGPYTVVGQTADKTVSTMTVSSLTPGTPYYFVVRTHTDAHAWNTNIVESEDSGEVSAATLAQLMIQGTILQSGSPLESVLMSGLPGDPATNASGVYLGTVDPGWSGTVTPVLAGHTFVPPSRSYTGIMFDQRNHDYEGALAPTTVTVTSPNGGESWQAGSTQNVTWSATGMTGEVTIDLYKGGIYQKTLGTADASVGTFIWLIDAGETPGADYRVVVWQGGVSDESDDDFSIATAAIQKDDLIGTWDDQGVYYRNSDTGAWVKLASPADMITTGDLDGDGIDDLIGLWPGQGGIWVKYSASGTWVRLSSTARYIGSGDMNSDGRVDLLGTWDGQGVYYRDSMTGAWVKMASEATMITSGDIDGDGTDDLIGLWPAQGGIWVKYSSTSAWARLSSTAVHIGAGDMNGDGRDDLLGTWDGQGVYYRDSMTGSWVKMASPATLITAGDIDGDGTGDLVGIWPSQGGVWVKYSETGAWVRLSSTARDIATGKMRPASLPAPSGTLDAEASALTALELPYPMGGYEEGPAAALHKKDLSMDGPGGWRFLYMEERNLEPKEAADAATRRIPGPGEPGFIAEEQKNIFPMEGVREKREPGPKRKDIKK